MYILRTVACITPFDGREKLHLENRSAFNDNLHWAIDEADCKLKCLKIRNCKMVFYLSGGITARAHECYTLPYILDRTHFRHVKGNENERFISYRPEACDFNDSVGHNG